MRGLKIIPHSTLSNENIKDLTKALHQPIKYSQRYNFACIDKLMKEGEPIKLNRILKKDIFKKITESKEDTDLAILQNTFIYEVVLSNKNVEFRIFHRDLQNSMLA